MRDTLFQAGSTLHRKRCRCQTGPIEKLGKKSTIEFKNPKVIYRTPTKGIVMLLTGTLAFGNSGLEDCRKVPGTNVGQPFIKKIGLKNK
jgi:hypothetical protein